MSLIEGAPCRVGFVGRWVIVAGFALPVAGGASISRQQAREYCEWAGKRLCSEAERTFAAPAQASGEEPGPAGDPADPLDGGPHVPYVYQRHGDGPAMSVGLSYEAAYGTRESRHFAPDGVEQGLRVRFQPLSFLGLEAFAGVVLDPGDGGRRAAPRSCSARPWPSPCPRTSR